MKHRKNRETKATMGKWERDRKSREEGSQNEEEVNF